MDFDLWNLTWETHFQQVGTGATKERESCGMFPKHLFETLRLHSVFIDILYSIPTLSFKIILRNTFLQPLTVKQIWSGRRRIVSKRVIKEKYFSVLQNSGSRSASVLTGSYIPQLDRYPLICHKVTGRFNANLSVVVHSGNQDTTKGYLHQFYTLKYCLVRATKKYYKAFWCFGGAACNQINRQKQTIQVLCPCVMTPPPFGCKQPF